MLPTRTLWYPTALLLALTLAACDEEKSQDAAAEPAPPAETVPAASEPAEGGPPSTPPAIMGQDAVAQLPEAENGARVPLVPGLTLVSVLTFPEGDRENVVTVESVQPEGVMYAFHFRQRGGGQDAEGKIERFVRETDLASAPRINTVYLNPRRDDTPGYTSFTISRAVYGRLLESDSVPFTITALEGSPFGTAGLAAATAGLMSTRITLKGSFTRASGSEEWMPMLLNGRRVRLPVVRLRGRFAAGDHRQHGDYWVLADSAHPLVLRSVIGDDVLQTIRIELPETLRTPTLESELASTCRAELPGIYFAFASAELESASDRAIAGVAELLGRHPDWSLAVEGHTDSIGDPASNQALSLRRAEAVRQALIGRHAIGADRLSAQGFGASRPREPNATIEGRARNRRVELVRSCPEAGR